MGELKVLMNAGGIAMTNSFVVADEASKQAVIFDAPNDTVLPLLQQVKARGWDLIGLWLTHGHFDHIADHAVVKSWFPQVRVLIHPLDEPKLISPRTGFFVLPFTIPPGKADGLVNDGDVLSIGNHRVEVIHTPGHAPGHVMYHFPEHLLLVGGDLIIMGAVGRTDLPDSDPSVLNQSIRKVMKLPPRTRLLPGHGEPRTLAEELEDNEYVQAALDEM